ncbi:hypothetical protein N9Y01_01970 [Candidatus Poseidonia alphae]|nr:hypothetical protein [Candidatus Poseidonia alphae]MDB2637287.1 hypothetical protein [Candidatus Poseidonia alphae]
MIKNQSNNDERGRTFIAWSCKKVREARPLGMKQREGCGEWSVKASKHRLGEVEHLQANCPSCGRRSRLNPRTRQCYEYTTREAAQQMADILNKEAVE